MVPAQTHHNLMEDLDGSSFGADDFTDDDCSEDIVSLLEENARLRKLVLSLSAIVLRNVTETN